MRNSTPLANQTRLGVVIASSERGGKPVARLTQLVPIKRKIRFGVLKRRVRIPKDFDAPLPDAILAEFEGRS